MNNPARTVYLNYGTSSAMTSCDELVYAICCDYMR